MAITRTRCKYLTESPWTLPMFLARLLTEISRNFASLSKEDGVSLSQPDGNGYYALQWAALNNFAAIVQYIIEVGEEFWIEVGFCYF